jgi:hypothetical protein
MGNEEHRFDLPRIFGEGVLSPGNIIRCAVPGFISLYVLMFVDGGFNPFKNETSVRYPDWVIIIAIVLAGFFIQAIHATILIRFMWLPAIVFHRYIKKNHLINTLYKKLDIDLQKSSCWNVMNNIRICWDIMNNIDQQRWKRRSTENKEVRRYQQQLDNWGVFQNLLYCSTYITILIPIYIKLTRSCYIRPYWSHILYAGFFLLIFAIISECRATNAELRASNEYFIGI